MTRAPDLVVAYLIKDTAKPRSDLANALDHICHDPQDGKLDINDVGLAGIRGILEK